MSDWRDDDVDDELQRGSRTSSELLDLVRDAEDDARIATRQAPPSSAAQVVEADELLPEDQPSADVVDVGDDAIDAPPSRPPQPQASPETAAARPLELAAPDRGLPPLVAILLLFALIGAVLALITR